MSQAFFLIPGLLLPESARGALDGTLSAAAPLFSRLSDEPMQQDLAQGIDSGCTHLLWAWAVITRKPFPVATAPYRWLIAQAPDTATEIWHLTLAHSDDAGRLEELPRALTGSELDTVCERLRSRLDDAGFWLQRWDNSLFLSRKKDWGVRTRPWETLRGRAPQDSDWEAADSATAAAAQEFVKDIQTLLTSPLPVEIDGIPVNALWIHGGGRERLFFPPTLLRSVLADDTAITGWGQAAGLLNDRTGPARGVRRWPKESPRGDCLAVISDLYDPWLAQDWNTWRARLPAVVEQIAALSQDAAVTKGCDARLVVATGSHRAVSMAAKLHGKPLSILARLAQRGNSYAPCDWLFEDLL